MIVLFCVLCGRAYLLAELRPKRVSESAPALTAAFQAKPMRSVPLGAVWADEGGGGGGRGRNTRLLTERGGATGGQLCDGWRAWCWW